MKKITIILCALVVLAISVKAQIPNSGFETWENYVDNYTSFIYQKPDKWNGSLPNNMQYSFSISKNPESYPAGTGQYSMKIQADLANGVRGVAISNDGHDSMTNWIPQPSFAINSRPSSLYLYYKCFPSGGDTIIGIVYFYKNGVVIGNPSFGTTQTVSTWTAMEVPMTYTTMDVPDSATILFVTGAYTQHSGSILYVDNLSFTGFVTSVSATNSANVNFNLYPNPATDVVNLNLENNNSSVLTVNIYNLMGALVKSDNLKPNEQQIKVDDLNNGIYLVEVKSDEWTSTQKLVIKK